MDPNALGGMIFVIILIALIGGIIIVTPLARRLGALLELRLQEKVRGMPPDGGEIAGLRKLVTALEEEVRALREQQSSLEERQQFVEKLLEPGRPGRAGRVPAGESTPPAP